MRVGVIAQGAAPLLLALLTGGCRVEVRGPEVTDAELQRAGQWTSGDGRARALLDLEAPPHLRGRYPVRLVPARRKLLTEVQVGETTFYVPRLAGLLGLDYERRYQYVAAVKGYVLLNREGAATVVSEDAEAKVELPVERTSPRVFRELGEQLERDLQAIHEAADRAPPVQP